MLVLELFHQLFVLRGLFLLLGFVRRLTFVFLLNLSLGEKSIKFVRKVIDSEITVLLPSGYERRVPHTSDSIDS